MMSEGLPFFFDVVTNGLSLLIRCVIGLVVIAFFIALVCGSYFVGFPLKSLFLASCPLPLPLFFSTPSLPPQFCFKKIHLQIRTKHEPAKTSKQKMRRGDEAFIEVLAHPSWHHYYQGSE